MTYDKLVLLNEINKKNCKNTNCDEKVKDYCKHRLEREDNKWCLVPQNGKGKTAYFLKDVGSIYKFFHEVSTFYVTNISRLKEDSSILSKYYVNRGTWNDILNCLKRECVSNVIFKRVYDLRSYKGKTVLLGGRILFENNFILCIYVKGICYILSEYILKVDYNTSFDFGYLEELRNLYIRNIDSSELKYLYKFCIGCISLESVSFENFDTRNIVSFESMFEACYCLREINFKCFDTSNVETLKYMFKNCVMLKNIDLSSFCTNSIRCLDEMFCNCKNLENLNVNTWVLSKCISYNDMFKDCCSNIRINKEVIQSIPNKEGFLEKSKFKGMLFYDI